MNRSDFSRNIAILGMISAGMVAVLGSPSSARTALRSRYVKLAEKAAAAQPNRKPLVIPSYWVSRADPRPATRPRSRGISGAARRRHVRTRQGR